MIKLGKKLMLDGIRPGLQGIPDFVLASLLICSSAAADTGSKYDRQVEDLKADMLAISAKLKQLDDDYVYPANTRLDVFVSISRLEDLSLDTVNLVLDGKGIAEHLYNAAELAALKQGSAQRLYSGNVAGGEHVLTVSLIGQSAKGQIVRKSAAIKFAKGSKVSVFEAVISGAGGDDVDIGFGYRN